MTLFARHFFTLFVTFGEMLWFTFVDKFCQIGHNLRIFVAFWWNIVIYALCRILVKCSDLRIFPSKKFRIPGTKNYHAALVIILLKTNRKWSCEFFRVTFCFKRLSRYDDKSVGERKGILSAKNWTAAAVRPPLSWPEGFSGGHRGSVSAKMATLTQVLTRQVNF